MPCEDLLKRSSLCLPGKNAKGQIVKYKISKSHNPAGPNSRVISLAVPGRTKEAEISKEFLIFGALSNEISAKTIGIENDTENGIKVDDNAALSFL